jgi:hypothetical protein
MNWRFDVIVAIDRTLIIGNRRMTILYVFSSHRVFKIQFAMLDSVLLQFYANSKMKQSDTSKILQQLSQFFVVWHKWIYLCAIREILCTKETV